MLKVANQLINSHLRLYYTSRKIIRKLKCFSSQMDATLKLHIPLKRTKPWHHNLKALVVYHSPGACIAKLISSSVRESKREVLDVYYGAKCVTVNVVVSQSFSLHKSPSTAYILVETVSRSVTCYELNDTD